MSTNRIEQIANAVLYEGYMLYPYRPSAVKNRQRFNFGVLYPREHSESQLGNDLWQTQTECLVSGSPSTEIGVKARFLQAIMRTTTAHNGAGSAMQLDESSAGQRWQQATEREFIVPNCSLKELLATPRTHAFTFPAKVETETVRNKGGQIDAVNLRTQEALTGKIEITGQQVQESPSAIYKFTLVVSNTVTLCSTPENRELLLQYSMIATHSVLTVQHGEFISLLEPPASLQQLTAACKNVGTWPVLVGEESSRDTMLSSPIILYDYPQTAPESPGDLFDGGEVDEILSLRIMTMTDEEKQEMRQSDERARKILERTENLPEEQFMKLHGALRGLRNPSGGLP